MSTPNTFILQSKDSTTDELFTGRKVLAALVSQWAKNTDPNAKDTNDNIYTSIREKFKLYIESSYRQYPEMVSEYVKMVPATAGTSYGQSVTFDITQQDDFWSDMVVNIQLGALGSQTAAATGNTQYVYCDYPGVRLFEDIALSIDGNPIDNYGPDSTMYHREFEVDSTKQGAWDQSVGQQTPTASYLYNRDSQTSTQYMICNGPQTQNTYQPPLDLWVPLDFWFNKGIENALFVGNSHWGQRFITIKLAGSDKIAQSLTPVGPYQSDSEPTFTVGSAVPSIVKCDLYVNGISLHPELLQVYNKTLTFALARLHGSFKFTFTTNSTDQILSKIKYATEYLYFGFRPIANESSFTNWYKMTAINAVNILLPVSLIDLTNPTGPPILGRYPVVYNQPIIPFDTVGIYAGSGIVISDMKTNVFYNGYLVTRDTKLQSPMDPGKMVYLFNQKPLERDMSGYIPLSRIRDLQIKYSSSFISAANPTRLVVESRGINILLISRSMAIKFIT